MAENKKKGLTFKELPGYCKAMRIVMAVLMLLAAIQMIVAAVLSIDNPYLWYLYMPAIGFAVPAIVVGIIDLNLEKKYKAKLDAQPQQAPEEEKKVEAPKQETPKQQDGGWDCPNCGAHNQGKFCIKCGTKKPEQAAVAAAAPAAVASEPARAEAPKKSNKGLIIGLSVGGGCLVLAGLIVGGVFGVKAIADSLNGGGANSTTKDSLPADYEFTVPYGTVDYETEDATQGFVFYQDKKVREYCWTWSNSYKEYRIYEIKEGTYTYTKSTQTINVSITEYQVYSTDWHVYQYEAPEQLTFKIKSETKMVYSASNINDTVVKKVTTFTNSTSKKYTGS